MKNITNFLKFFLKKTFFFKLYSSFKNKNKSKNYFSKIVNHEIMLADLSRSNAYEKLIRKYITSNDIVCDLGTGTGLLSFLASKNKPKTIYAIEHSNIINIAKKIAELNNIKNIKFIKTNSKKFFIKENISVIIHEQIGNAIFDENMISNIVDLRERLLKKDGLIIPNIFELYLEPVSLIDYFKIPRIYENNFSNINYKNIKDYVKENFNEMNYRILPRIAIKEILSLPSPIFSLNLNTIKNENEVPKYFNIHKKLKSHDQIDGFCIFFKAKYNNDLVYNTMKIEKSHPMSWGIPFYRSASKNYKNEAIVYTLSITNLLNPSSWIVKVR